MQGKMHAGYVLGCWCIELKLKRKVCQHRKQHGMGEMYTKKVVKTKIKKKKKKRKKRKAIVSLLLR